MVNRAPPPVGLLRKATIIGITQQQGYITAQMDLSSQTLGDDLHRQRKVQVPFPFSSSDGMFIGGKPQLGTPIIIGQGEGTSWYFVSFFFAQNPDSMPELNDGVLFMQASDTSKITVSNDDAIYLGSDTTNLYLDTSPKKYLNKLQTTFSNEFSFSEAARDITGIIKREVMVDQTPSSLKLISDTYDNNLTPIALDPTTTSVISSAGANKNPPFVERKEIIYEFAYSSNVADDITESAIYSPTQQPAPQVSQNINPNRRQSKTDGFSLSLVAPNYLIETIKGTGVDIFGNILDINRAPILGFGVTNSTLSLNSKSSKETSFLNIKAAERKSLAYHFEINARKDLTAQNGQDVLPNVNSSADYARVRSRFFFDVDKEGQLKLNVPASSETGNIPLHVRYENFSTWDPKNNGDYNEFVIRKDYLDIFLDSYVTNDPTSFNGSIAVNNQTGPATPIDRLTGNHIKHGMPYHNITASGQVFQTSVAQQFIGYQNAFTPINVAAIPTLSDVVSPTIITAGPNANAGGRSGSMNFDGSLEVSLGANTIDRQSLWLDTAGGLIANVGRDFNNTSATVSLDGDLLVQIGGHGIYGDSRFAGSNWNNGYRGGALDIRVLNDGFTATMIRVDKSGVSIMTPTNMTFYANVMNFNATTMNLDGDNIYIGGRWVNRNSNAQI